MVYHPFSFRGAQVLTHVVTNSKQRLGWQALRASCTGHEDVRKTQTLRFKPKNLHKIHLVQLVVSKSIIQNELFVFAANSFEPHLLRVEVCRPRLLRPLPSCHLGTSPNISKHIPRVLTFVVHIVSVL